MTRKNIQTLWLSLVLSLALLIVGVPSAPSQAQGSWPPFAFSVTPVYAAGQITYSLFFLSYSASNGLVDVDIRIPLPEGTRYVEGSARNQLRSASTGRKSASLLLF